MTSSPTDPEERDRRWDEHNTNHEFADCPASRNARDKHANERRPGNPPNPIKDCPAALPGYMTSINCGPEAHRNDVPEMIA